MKKFALLLLVVAALIATALFLVQQKRRAPAQPETSKVPEPSATALPTSDRSEEDPPLPEDVDEIPPRFKEDSPEELLAPPQEKPPRAPGPASSVEGVRELREVMGDLKELLEPPQEAPREAPPQEVPPQEAPPQEEPPQEKPARAPKTVSIVGGGRDLREVLEELGAQCGQNLLLEPGVEARVDLTLDGVGWREALETLASSSGCEVEKAGAGTYLLVCYEGQRVHMPRMEVRRALLFLAGQAEVNIVIGPKVQGSVSVQASDQPVLRIIDKLVEASATEAVWYTPNSLVVTAAGLRVTEPRPAKTFLREAEANFDRLGSPETLMNLEVVNQPLAEVAALLAKASGQAVRVSPEAASEAVIVTLRELPWVDVARIVARLCRCRLSIAEDGALVFAKPPLVSLSSQSMSIREALKRVAQSGGFTLELPAEIRGQISLELSELFWCDAAAMILRSFGPDYRLEEQGSKLIVYDAAARKARELQALHARRLAETRAVLKELSQSEGDDLNSDAARVTGLLKPMGAEAFAVLNDPVLARWAAGKPDLLDVLEALRQSAAAHSGSSMLKSLAALREGKPEALAAKIEDLAALLRSMHAAGGELVGEASRLEESAGLLYGELGRSLAMRRKLDLEIGGFIKSRDHYDPRRRLKVLVNGQLVSLADPIRDREGAVIEDLSLLGLEKGRVRFRYKDATFSLPVPE